MSDLRSQLHAIYDEYGELTPSIIVEVARPVDHPLHQRIFDRPPKEAAEAWYLHRAEELIRTVKVTVNLPRSGKQRIRWWHPVREESPTVYDPLDVIADDPLLMQILLRDAERQWKDMKRRYGHLAAFWQMVKRDAA